MDIVQLKQQIKSGQLENVYIMTGEEIGIMNIYVNKMGDDIVRADSVLSIWRQLTSKSLMEGFKTYVVRDDKDFLKEERVWTRLSSEVKYGRLILIYTELDKRSKFYKHFQSDLVVFEKMTKAQLVAYVIKDKDLSLRKADAEYLVDACQCDYTQVNCEMDKLKRFEYTDVRDAIDQIVISPESYNSFSFMNCLLQNKSEKAVQQLHYLMQQGESSIMLLGLMYSNFRQAAEVLGQKSTDSKEIAEKLKMNAWQVSNILNNFNYQPASTLAAMRIIQDCESGIKLGKYEETKAAMIATVRILGLA